MKPKTMILMFVAIGCGLAASYMTSRVIAERSTEAAEVEKVSVLVAKKNLALGMLIKDPAAQFEEKFYIKGEEPKKAIRDLVLLKDKRLSKSISAEQFVTEEDLFNKDNGALDVQAGMRAVGLKVNVESSGGGFVLPHSRVDLVHVVKTEKETTSKIIMQNVLVLAVDQAAVKPEDKNSFVPQTVTVEVTPTQAETLALAQDIGSIKLILRGFGDDEKVHTAGVTPKGINLGGEGKADESEESFLSKESAPKLASKIPDVPDPSAIAEVKAPPSKLHILCISNGESTMKVPYQLDANDAVIVSSGYEKPAVEDEGPPPVAPTTPVKTEAPKVLKKSYKPVVTPPAAKTDPKQAQPGTTSPSAKTTGFLDAPLPGLPAKQN
jgi:Flp pilus assembly protein CpaB